MIADLFLGLEHRDARMIRERRSGGQAGNPAADYEDVGTKRHGWLTIQKTRERNSFSDVFSAELHKIGVATLCYDYDC
jgi:hypothetical protein